MSDIQIGDQSSKPQDLEKTEATLNAVIEAEVKKQASSLKGLEKMTRGATQGEFSGSSFLGGGTNNNGGGGSSFTEVRPRKKGSVTLKEFRSPVNPFNQDRRDKAEVMSRERVAESAFAGKLNRKSKFSTFNARDLAEECQLLKARWAWLPKGLAANKDLLGAFGFGHLKEAHDAIQAEKVKPQMQAVISGTANDMEKFQSLFKNGLDSNIKEAVYSNASSQMKTKLNPLMS